MQQPGCDVGRHMVAARSNYSRIAVEPKLNLSCNHRLTLLQGRYRRSMELGSFSAHGFHKPWIDLVEIWHVWLCHQLDSTYRIWWPPQNMVRWVKLYLRVFFLFSSLNAYTASPLWATWIFAQYTKTFFLWSVRYFRVILVRGLLSPIFIPQKTFCMGHLRL